MARDKKRIIRGKVDKWSLGGKSPSGKVLPRGWRRTRVYLGEPPVCPDCGQRAVLRDAGEVYGKRLDPDRNVGQMWVCPSYPKCHCYVSCHPKSTEPMGRMANERTRYWRMQAHKALDPLWRRARREKWPQARSRVYDWLADTLGIDRDDCHVAHFDADTCIRVVELCKTHPDYAEKEAAE